MPCALKSCSQYVQNYYSLKETVLLDNVEDAGPLLEPNSRSATAPVMNFGEVRTAQLAKSTLLTSSLVPLGSFQISSDSKERVGCGKQREATASILP